MLTIIPPILVFLVIIMLNENPCDSNLSQGHLGNYSYLFSFCLQSTMSQFHSEILVELNLRNSKNYIMKFGSITIISQSKPANETHMGN